MEMPVIFDRELGMMFDSFINGDLLLPPTLPPVPGPYPLALQSKPSCTGDYAVDWGLDLFFDFAGSQDFQAKQRPEFTVPKVQQAPNRAVRKRQPAEDVGAREPQTKKCRRGRTTIPGVMKVPIGPLLPNQATAASSRKVVRRSNKNPRSCVRCRIMKRPCYGGSPCFECRNSMSSCNAYALVWMPCIVNTISDANIFRLGCRIKVSKALTDTVARYKKVLALDVNNQSFRIPTALTPEKISKDLADWACNKFTLERGRFYYELLPSRAFQAIIAAHLGPEIAESFRLTKITSMLIAEARRNNARNKNNHSKSSMANFVFDEDSLLAICQQAGDVTLTLVNRFLNTKNLQRLSPAASRCLWAVIFGLGFAIVNTGTSQADTFCVRSDDPLARRSRHYEAAETHLLDILTCHIRYLADKLISSTADATDWAAFLNHFSSSEWLRPNSSYYGWTNMLHQFASFAAPQQACPRSHARGASCVSLALAQSADEYARLYRELIGTRVFDTCLTGKGAPRIRKNGVDLCTSCYQCFYSLGRNCRQLRNSGLRIEGDLAIS